MRTLSITLLALFFACTVATSQRKTSARPNTIQLADSLYAASKWRDAIPVYEEALKAAPANAQGWNRLGFSYHNTADYAKALAAYNTALANKPTQQMAGIVHSRMARIYALQKQVDQAFASLDKALESGYAFAGELKDNRDFDNIRGDGRFAGALEKATRNAFPCLSIKQAREFDFWIGEWDVYANGSETVVGHSKIEMASGGCMILENWTAIGPMPSNGKSMNYVNSVTGKWEQLWVGSGGLGRTNPQKFVDGEYKDGAMRFVFEQYLPQGTRQIGRFIFYNEGPDQVRQFNEVSSDNGQTWTTSYDLIYKRRK